MWDTDLPLALIHGGNLGMGEEARPGEDEDEADNTSGKTSDK